MSCLEKLRAQNEKSRLASVVDWTVKFKDYVTPSGNMRRSLTPEQKTEIFQYRIKDKYKVLGTFVNNKDRVLCECVSCTTKMELVPGVVLAGKTPCQSCAGKLKREVTSTGIVPINLRDKLPKHVTIKGVDAPYRGVLWLDMERVNREVFYIVKQANRDLYAFVTLDLKWFKGSDIVLAQLYALGCEYTSSTAMAVLYEEIPNFEIGHKTWEGWKFAPRQSWHTKYAEVIRYCMEKRFKKRRYPHLMGMDDRDIPCFCLTPEDLAELAEIQDIEEVLAWDL
jgi:hypothetical protein